MRQPQTFVALDGEGINDRYVLLQDSHGGELLNLRGLSTETLFKWLLKRHEELASINPCFVGFVTSYDVNMILRDIDDETLKSIFRQDDKDFVVWHEWEFLYIPRKVFKLRRFSSDGESRQAKAKRTFTWYDIYTFFQSSFVKVCDSLLGETADEIRSGKRERRDFQASGLDRIRRYNQLECAYLVRICNRLRDILSSQSLDIVKWHGPGAVAEYLLGKRGMDLHTEYPRYSEDEVPLGLAEAWDCAYYGGRFETTGVGTFRNVSAYDINSAYPKALSTLTILDYASRWKRQIKPRDVSHGMNAVYLVSWNVNNGAPFGPFPWRHKSGGIFYPLNGLGWYWQTEVAAAQRSFPGSIKLHEVWYQPESQASILQSEIPRLYELRKRLKAAGDGGEYAIKLALNSLYGKLAQKVGHAPFRCIPWAGQVTAYSRAMLLDATRGKEKNVIAFATDSIVSSKPLKLPLGSKLGQWKPEKYRSFMALMSGVYRCDDVTVRKDGHRGMPKPVEKPTEDADFTWNDVIESLNRKQAFSYSRRSFVTHSIAINFRKKYGDKRLTFVDMDKTIKPFQNTRRKFRQHVLADWERDNVLSDPLRFPTVELSFPSSLVCASVEIEEGEE